MPKLRRCAGGLAFLLLIASVCGGQVPAPAPPLPAAARQRLRQAAAEVDAGRAAAAIAGLRQLAREYPRSAAVAETLGLAFIQQQQLATALPRLRLAVSLAPNSPAMLANLGITELRLGDLRQGIRRLRQAVALEPRGDPGNFDNIYDLGQALAEASNYPEAASWLARAHALRPGRPDVAYNWALAAHRAHRNAAAAQALGSVSALAQSAQAQALWGTVAEAQGQYENAARHFQAAVRLAPTAANFLALGVEFLRHLTWNAARLTFQRGLRRYPHDRRLRTALGITDFGQSDFSGAVETFGALSAAHPLDPYLAAMLGRSCLQGGMARQAPCQALIAQAAAHPSNPAAAAYAAVIALNGGSSPAAAARALRLARRAVRDDPRLAEAQFAVGLALGRAGHWRQSIPSFQAALRRDPGDATAIFQLALAYQRTGQTALAQDMLRRHAQLAADQRRVTNRRLAHVRQFVTQIGKTAGEPH